MRLSVGEGGQARAKRRVIAHLPEGEVTLRRSWSKIIKQKKREEAKGNMM